MTDFALLRLAPVLCCFVFASSAYAQVSALNQKSPDAAEISTIATSQGYVRVIVQFDSPVPVTQITPDPVTIANVKAQIAAVQDAIISSHFGSATNPTEGQGFLRHLVRFDITPGFAINVNLAELQGLAADPRVRIINYDRAVPPTLLQSVPLIGMANAYNAGANGSGYLVAILDTGTQSNHEFLAGKVVAEACFSNSGGTAVSLCPNGQKTQTGTGAAQPIGQCFDGTTNICRHGTHVAGIAVGLNTNQSPGRPTNAVAKNGNIFAIQVFSRFNSAADCTPRLPPCVKSFVSDQVSALNYVFSFGVGTIAAVNMSLGGGRFTAACDTEPQKPAIDLLRSAGIPTVIASGNDGFTNAINSPACISTAIAVGSTTKTDVISSFSNMSSQVALLAPGGELGGSCAFGANNPGILAPVAVSPLATDSYNCLSGTSMAAPHVAGAIAAMRTVCPSTNITNILAALQSTGLLVTDTRTGGTQIKPRIKVDPAQFLCGGPSPIATHDFNADGNSDIAWRDNIGDTAIWLMNGGQIIQTGGLGLVPTTWSIVGQRDFNGDRRYDWLWRDSSTQTVAIWLLSGLQVVDSRSLGVLPSSLTIAGTSDFNADGNGDILLRDSNTGEVSIALLNGFQVQQTGSLGVVPNNWTISGMDGKGDIFWRDSNTGDAAIWVMGSLTITQTAVLGAVPNNWTIFGTGDFDGNGWTDILWRDTSGNVAIWLMNGFRILAAGVLGNPGTTWNVAQTGDYNGDGKSDILWRHTSGDTAIWFMNGLTISGTAGFGNIPTTWTVQGVNAD